MNQYTLLQQAAGPSSLAATTMSGWPSSSAVPKAASPQQQPRSNGSSKGKRKAKYQDAEALNDLLDGSDHETPTAVSAKKIRKKANRACFHCQKAHLTCDDSRPCARCVKRNLAETCQDGKRKKAKYLADFDDEALQRRSSPVAQSNGIRAPDQATNPSAEQSTLQSQTPVFSTSYFPLPTASTSTQNYLPSHFASNQSIPSLSFDNKFGAEFGSENANLEYAMLSSMLNGEGSPSDSSVSGNLNFTGLAETSGMPFQFSTLSQQSPQVSNNIMGPPYNVTQPGFQQGASSSSLPLPSSSSLPLPNHMMDTSPASQALSIAKIATSNSQQSSLVSAQYPTPTSNTSRPSLLPQHAHLSLAHANSELPALISPCGAMRAEDVYNKITKPYPYAQSYHDLIKHIKDRFDKMDILRIVRALAKFRPSLIALQMPLTEEDEIFVEKCFQRTLIEYEKLITFSGTPTVVWRRTGEICLIGAEFSLLCQWDRQELLSKKSYIFELLDASSVVEYYEALATHAFENSTQTVMSTCVLLTPDKKPVPCSFCFTIKRDLFNCPQLVVGQFLPLLS